MCVHMCACVHVWARSGKGKRGGGGGIEDNETNSDNLILKIGKLE